MIIELIDFIILECIPPKKYSHEWNGDLLNKKTVEESIKNFSKNKKCEVITLSTFNKDSVTKIKAKLLNYAS